MPIWFNDSRKLRNKLEDLAKNIYRKASTTKAEIGENLITPAEQVALLYILMDKKSNLISLFERESASNGDKVAALLSKDFSDPKNAKTAVKNAGALRKRTNDRMPFAATWYLIGGDIRACV